MVPAGPFTTTPTVSPLYDTSFMDDAELDPPDPPLYDEPWDDDEPPETWGNHPSLTTEQRNPTLR